MLCHRMADDRVRSRFRRGLNRVEQLLALVDGVAVSENDSSFNAQALRHLCHRAGLLALIFVLVVNQRDQDFEFLHEVIPGSGMIGQESAGKKVTAGERFLKGS